MYFIDNNLLDVLPDTYTKSPLHYPGGKTSAVKYLLSFIPNNYDVYASPFIGGASTELAIASCGKKVFGYDIFDYVVCFWKEALKDANTLALEAEKEYPLTRERFYQIQHADHTNDTQFEKALTFYILNKSSFSGTGFSGGCSSESLKSFSKTSIEKFKSFKNPGLEVDKKSFDESIELHKDSFLYLDPPYINKAQNLYGKNGSTHKSFEHEKLADILNSRGAWVLSYNDCEQVRSMYAGHRMFILDWHHGMSKSHYDEILIVSNDLADVKER